LIAINFSTISFFVFKSSKVDSVDLVQDNDSMMVQTPQSLQGNPGGGGGDVGGGFHANPSSSNTPVHSAPSSLDSQTQNANLYGDGRDYSSPVALDHLPSPWQHHLNQHSAHSHSYSPAPGGGGGNNSSNQQDRSFKSEPEHGASGDFSHVTAVRSEAVVVNDAERVCLLFFSSFFFLVFNS